MEAPSKARSTLVDGFPKLALRSTSSSFYAMDLWKRNNGGRTMRRCLEKVNTSCRGGFETESTRMNDLLLFEVRHALRGVVSPYSLHDDTGYNVQTTTTKFAVNWSRPSPSR